MSKLSKLTLCLITPFLISAGDSKNLDFDYKIKKEIFYIGNMCFNRNSKSTSLNIGLFDNIVSYSFNKLNDSTYIERLGVPKERYLYKKRNGFWELLNYKGKREYKQDLEGDFKTKAIPLVDIPPEDLKFNNDTLKFFLLGENYYFYTKSSSSNIVNFKIGGIKVRKEDKNIFDENVSAKYNGKELPDEFRTSFKVKSFWPFNGTHHVTGKLKNLH